MIRRRYIDKPAQITFTRDFHELVTGDLRPGNPVTLSYDPARIVPAAERYVFGDPRRPIIASVRFQDGGPVINAALESPGGMLEQTDDDVTGQGSMLKTHVIVPANAAEVIVWFSYVSAGGGTFYDSDYGQNFHFGFPGRDIAVLSATVVSDPEKSQSRFAVSVAAAHSVWAVSVRVHPYADAKGEGREVKLEKTDESDEHSRPVWSVADIAVPNQSTVRFKVYYWVGSRRFKDDNGGHYYLAPQPEPDKVAPPPAELTEAALAWK